jgi:hypothetical protein
VDIATPFPGRPPMPFLGPRGSAVGSVGLGDAASDAAAAQVATAALLAAQQAYQTTLLSGQLQQSYNPYANTATGYLAVQPGVVSGGMSGGTVLLIALAIGAFWMAKNR